MVILLAQQTTTLDPWSLSISIIALIVAALVGGLTIIQSQAMRRIETREHEWQATDRKSAYIKVTRWRENLTGTPANNDTRHMVNDWIRLKNTGRATAWDVQWKVVHAARCGPTTPRG